MTLRLHRPKNSLLLALYYIHGCDSGFSVKIKGFLLIYGDIREIVCEKCPRCWARLHMCVQSCTGHVPDICTMRRQVMVTCMVPYHVLVTCPVQR